MKNAVYLLSVDINMVQNETISVNKYTPADEINNSIQCKGVKVVVRQNETSVFQINFLKADTDLNQKFRAFQSQVSAKRGGVFNWIKNRIFKDRQGSLEVANNVLETFGKDISADEALEKIDELLKNDSYYSAKGSPGKEARSNILKELRQEIQKWSEDSPYHGVALLADRTPSGFNKFSKWAQKHGESFERMLKIVVTQDKGSKKHLSKDTMDGETVEENDNQNSEDTSTLKEILISNSLFKYIQSQVFNWAKGYNNNQRFTSSY